MQIILSVYNSLSSPLNSCISKSCGCCETNNDFDKKKIGDSMFYTFGNKNKAITRKILDESRLVGCFTTSHHHHIASSSMSL